MIMSSDFLICLDGVGNADLRELFMAPATSTSHVKKYIELIAHDPCHGRHIKRQAVSSLGLEHGVIAKFS
jgi:hypothetical protein